MRRFLLLAVGALTLALMAPSGALAHQGHRGHHKHHKAHHARFHHKHIGAKPAHSGDPGTPSTGDAGTVASFTDGVLTITLTGGSTISGKVTDRTEIDCTTAPAPPTAPTATAAHHGGDDDQGENSGWGGGGRHHCHGPSACDASDLVAGAVVHEADLRIGPDGAEFKQIELVAAQSS